MPDDPAMAEAAAARAIDKGRGHGLKVATKWTGQFARALAIQTHQTLLNLPNAAKTTKRC